MRATVALSQRSSKAEREMLACFGPTQRRSPESWRGTAYSCLEGAWLGCTHTSAVAYMPVGDSAAVLPAQENSELTRLSTQNAHLSFLSGCRYTDFTTNCDHHISAILEPDGSWSTLQSPIYCAWHCRGVMKVHTSTAAVNGSLGFRSLPC